MFLDPTIINAIKIFVPATVAFFIGIAITPAVTHLLYKHRMWKKKAGKVDFAGNETPLFNKLHEEKEVGTPRMGGSIIWIATGLTTLIFALLSTIFPGETANKLDFLSRGQTWLPLATLLAGALVGLIDDYFEVTGKESYLAGGLSLKKRLLIVALMGLVGAWWFYSKLEIASIHIPFDGDLTLGIFFIPVFILVMLFIYSGGIIDGLDGLAGGIFSIIFAAYGIISFAQGQIDLAAFCFVVAGGLLAFLWFNIPPARFYMSETGSMALTATLVVVAFLTQQVVVLLLIALPLIMTTVTVILQVLSKRFRKKKIFLIAPLHHHFEAKGWPSYKVTMRYWVLTVIFAMIGVSIALVG